jgi:hypothetical protein
MSTENDMVTEFRIKILRYSLEQFKKKRYSLEILMGFVWHFWLGARNKHVYAFIFKTASIKILRYF